MDTLSETSIRHRSTSWLVLPRPNPQAIFRLFCFPYAGAGAVVFHTWPDSLPKVVEIISIQLPGRESRLKEAPYVSIQPVLQALTQQIEPFLDLPYAFYGHSLGALLAFELTRRLRKQRAALPVHLFLSSRRAPHIPDPKPQIHALPDPAFVKVFQQRYNGIPHVIMRDAELMAIFMTLLKADTSILENYRYEDEPVVSIPITVYGGLQDPSVTYEELSAWQKQTGSTFSITMLPGDHFFIQSQRNILLQTLAQELTPYL